MRHPNDCEQPLAAENLPALASSAGTLALQRAATRRRLAAFFLALSLLAMDACGSRFSGVPLAPPRSFTAGEDALARAEFETAAAHFSDYLASGRRTYRARALYLLARAQYQMEDYQAAQASLRRFEKEFPGFGRAQVTALHGDIAYALGNRVDAVLLWESAYARASAEERDVLRPRIAEAIRYLDADEAKELAAMLTMPQIYDLALARLDGTDGPPQQPTAGEPDPFFLSSALEPLPDPDAIGVADETEQRPAGWDGKDGGAETAAIDPALDELSADDVTPPGTVVAVADMPAARTVSAEPGVHIGPRIAALLPLTGSGRTAGGLALSALRRSIDANTLVVRDTGSDAVEAVDLARAMARDRDVIAVLGPMLPAEVAAVREAGITDLPILPLVERQAPRSSVDPAIGLAEHAVLGMGIKRIGILTPAAERASTFAGRATALGAEIVGTHRYQANAFDPDSVIAAVQEWTDSGGVDAVFIPDRAPRALQVAAAARAVAPRLALLGDAGWNDVAALAVAGASVDGAVIVGAGSGTGDVADTIARVSAVLLRAIALGESNRHQTRVILDEFASDPTQLVLLQVHGGRTQPIR